MAKVLLVQYDNLLNYLIPEGLRHGLDADVAVVETGLKALDMIEREHFDIALINATLPDIPGLRVAQVAANQDIPSLLLSGHPEISAELLRHGFPFLQKPFSLDVLVQETKNVIQETRNNIRRVTESAMKLQQNLAALTAEIAKTRQSMDKLRPPDSRGGGSPTSR
jgi:DNA-binding NtrC family response regulator